MSPKRRWISAPTRSGVADDGESVQHGVVDQAGHRRPVARARTAGAGRCAGRPSRAGRARGGRRGWRRRRRAVRGRRATAVSRSRVGVAGGDQPRVARSEPVAVAARRARSPRAMSGQGDLAQVALGGEAVHEHPVGDLGGDLGHPRSDGGEQHRRRPARVGRRGEHRRHQGVLVELAAEVEPGAVLPARPDGPQRQHELAHPGGRLGPRHAEPPLDVGLDLGAEAEDETAELNDCRSLATDGDGHRVAGERHRDRGAQRQCRGTGRRPAAAAGTGRG